MSDPAFPTFFLNGRLIPAEQARISPLDRGFLFADSVYEVMLVRRGQVRNLHRHLERLTASMNALDISAAQPPTDWQRQIQQLIAANGAQDAALYLQISRGAASSRSLLWDKPLQPTVFMFLDPLPYEQQFGQGLRAATAEDLRWQKCDIKANGLTANMVMRRTNALADEVILHRKGEVTEGTASNVFAVLDSQVITPPASPLILPGITRRLTVQALAQLDVPTEERPLGLSELRHADEIWITSVMRGVAPVVSLDARPVGSGRVGPVWTKLQPPLRLLREQPGLEERKKQA